MMNNNLNILVITEQRSGTHLLEELIRPHLEQLSIPMCGIEAFLDLKPSYQNRFFRIHPYYLIDPDFRRMFKNAYLNHPNPTTVVFLSRIDRLRQAISHVKVLYIEHNDLRIKKQHNYNPSVTETTEDFVCVTDDHVRECMLTHVLTYSMINLFFQDIGCCPLRLYYEHDLEQESQWVETMKKFISFIGIPGMEPLSDYSGVTKLLKISGKLTSDACEQFIARNLRYNYD